MERRPSLSEPVCSHLFDGSNHGIAEQLHRVIDNLKFYYPRRGHYREKILESMSSVIQQLSAVQSIPTGSLRDKGSQGVH